MLKPSQQPGGTERSCRAVGLEVIPVFSKLKRLSLDKNIKKSTFFLKKYKLKLISLWHKRIVAISGGFAGETPAQTKTV